jgi:hypothetical protein
MTMIPSTADSMMDSQRAASLAAAESSERHGGLRVVLFRET